MTLAWKDALKAYCHEWSAYATEMGEHGIPPGASDAAIVNLRSQVELRGLHLDDEVVELLCIVNGTTYNALRFFGAEIAPGDPFSRSDLIHSNDEYNDQPSRYTHYGTWDIDLYRFDNLTRAFEVVDNGGGDIVESFASFGELVKWAITTRVLQKYDLN